MRRAPSGFWTEDRCIVALQEWAREHDGRAARQTDWSRGASGHPQASILRRVFGNWNDGLAAAGLQTRPQGGATVRPDRGSFEERLAKLERQVRQLQRSVA